MIIHFVAEAFDYSFITPDARRIDIHDETHDPLTAVQNFHSFFHRIDGRGKRDILRLDTDAVKKAFWDRDEFLAALRESEDDVYVQASDYYTAKLMFLRQSDHTAFEARLAVPRVAYERTFHHSLHGEIKAFLTQQCDCLHENDWTAVTEGDNHTYRLRDETVAGMLEIKFAFTRQGDHSKPPPTLEECRKGVVPIAA